MGLQLDDRLIEMGATSMALALDALTLRVSLARVCLALIHLLDALYIRAAAPLLLSCPLLPCHPLEPGRRPSPPLDLRALQILQRVAHRAELCRYCRGGRHRMQQLGNGQQLASLPAPQPEGPADEEGRHHHLYLPANTLQSEHVQE